MLRKSRIIAMLMVFVMMFAVIEPTCAGWFWNDESIQEIDTWPLLPDNIFDTLLLVGASVLLGALASPILTPVPTFMGAGAIVIASLIALRNFAGRSDVPENSGTAEN